MNDNTNTLPKTLIVALTGSIGSGKSQAAAIFERLGAYIIDADKLAREVVQPNSAAFSEIVSLLGNEIVTSQGTLDRRRLAEIIFSDREKRLLIENILHPKIHALFKKRLAELYKRGNLPKLIVYVVPLLFESKITYDNFNSVIVVSAPPELSIKRSMQRDQCSEELARLRYNTQLPIKEKVALADYVINNDGSLLYLEEQVDKLYHKLVRKNDE